MSGFDSFGWRMRVAAARGTGRSSLVLAGGKILNVFTGELEERTVAITNGRITSIGDTGGTHEVIDCRGKIIAPSFVDPHIHTESSLVWMPEFARAVIPHGTGAIVTDPHEIANVAGIPGLDAMRAATQGLPMHIHFTAPSCVPASWQESPGAKLDAEEIAELLTWPETVGLGELMNVAGTIASDQTIAEKLRVAWGRRKDGHAPGVTGRRLQTYLQTGVTSDHESTTAAEALEKLRAGLFIMIRQGTSERNLDALLPLVDDATFPRFSFCSDDRDCFTLLHDGHVDAIVRDAIERGMDPIRAYRLATWNAADYWRLDGIGAVAPGYEANLNIITDLDAVEIEQTLFQGVVVAYRGEMVIDLPANEPPAFLLDSMNVGPLDLDAFRLDPKDATEAVVVSDGQIVTNRQKLTAPVEDGRVVTDVDGDILKLACIERHHATGRAGVGLVRGFALKKGAIASSIAHDAHNIVVVGVSDEDMLAAVQRVIAMNGGLATAVDGNIVADLPLPIGGIISDQPLATVSERLETMEQSANDLGCPLISPYGLLAFMALSVIPKARVTDHGFIHVA
ncbi:MAG: adenine deaminase [Thermomicrobiales bacterium]|nr:adenine deaminase [Thermomicrobiales bacterium]MCO5220607.1 adenine deaminase [Thermomicrobiales bacterium]